MHSKGDSGVTGPFWEREGWGGGVQKGISKGIANAIPSNTGY